MYSLKETDPDTRDFFASGHFAIQKNVIPFTAIGIDHAQEHLNKVLKGDRGLKGLNDTEALNNFCMTAPEIQRLSSEYEEMIGLSKRTRTEHHLLSSSIFERHEVAIVKLTFVLEENNPFYFARVCV